MDEELERAQRDLRAKREKQRSLIVSISIGISALSMIISIISLLILSL